MLRFARPNRHEGGLVHQFVVIVAMSVLSGVLMAGLALPWVGLLTKGAENGAEAVEDFPLELQFPPLNERTRVLASDGSKLAVFYDKNRKYVPLSKISDDVQSALIAIEDSRFYDHGALDVEGTVRALLANQTSDEVVQGGSSITQQLVKLTLLENAGSAEVAAAATEQSYARKFEELRYAVWVEEHLSKDQILEHYLNTAYYGDGAYGIEAASRHYFSTSAETLSLSQAALLAGLVKNPSGYDPTNNRSAALERRDLVIGRMHDLHVITTEEAKKARRSRLGLDVTNVPNGCLSSKAPFFCDYMLQYLLAQPELGATIEERRHLVYGGGLTIRTTIDLRFQEAADTSVQNHVFPEEQAIGGLAMVEPGTGYVRALAQSRPMGPKRQQGQTFLNFVVPDRYGDSRGFQSGSTFKVFVLASAIKQGIPLSKTIYAPAATSIPEVNYSTCGGQFQSTESWNVENYAGSPSGTMDLYSGTRYSVNTFFAELERLTGLCAPWRLAEDMGVNLYPAEQTGDIPGTRVPSFTLGIADVSPLEMAEAYATFAARGMHCASTPVLEIRDRDGELLPDVATDCQRLMRRAEADAVNDVLKGVMKPPYGFGQYIAPRQPSAGKTGTTSSQKAVWFVGHTPNLAAASMIAGANLQGSHLNLIGLEVGGEILEDASGSGTAGPMWGDAMKAVEKWLPDEQFVRPDPQLIEGQPVQIPSLYGYDPDEAAQALTELGFSPQIAETVNSPAPTGTVAYTSPSYEGVTGETVYLFISNGYVPPPPPVDPPTVEPPPIEPPLEQPVETVEPPVETVEPPVEEQDPPPTDTGDEQPQGGNDPPNGGDHNPGQGNDNPGRGNDNPGQGNDNPGRGN
ncbi:MAG: transglycosylase domain-containing protein [Nocardioidaceae bacterium]|nr:transglycosylase domain-containing protein [Nocardioidaceae bacterium]